jgi:8-oxo-dGTP diphosphatase
MMNNYVTGLMFSKDRTRIVLLTKLNPEWQRGQLNGIGGKIEPQEAAVDAMCREFFEETGVQTTQAQWQHCAVMTHRDTYHVNFFVTFDDQAFAAKTIEKEVVGVYDVAALPANLIRNLRWLIPLVLDTNMCFDTPVVFNEVTVPTQHVTTV